MGDCTCNPSVTSRVENRRSGFSLPVAVDEAFAASPQSGLAWLCFLFPLIEPDRRISRIRLSEGSFTVFAERFNAQRLSIAHKPSDSRRGVAVKTAAWSGIYRGLYSVWCTPTLIRPAHDQLYTFEMYGLKV